MPRAILAAALAAAAAAAPWLEETCANESCDEGESASLLQFPRPGPSVNCSTGRVPGSFVAPGSGMDDMCSGNVCCMTFGLSYPCPAAKARWAANPKNCQIPNLPTAVFIGYQSQPKYPNSRLYDGEAYTGVRLKGGEALESFLSRKYGFEIVKVLEPGDRGYDDGFYPPVLGAKLDDYFGLWGDLGSEVNPGYGGIKTYNVVKLKPPADRPFQLFHLDFWNPESSTKSCSSIWWGARDTFATSLVNASINIQTCSAYTSITRCDFTDAAEFTALVGQGWPRFESGFKSAACGDNFVARTLAGDTYPQPYRNKLQWVLPACQIAAFKGQNCQVCKLPAEEDKLKSINNLAAQFETPREGVTCQPIDLTAPYVTPLYSESGGPEPKSPAMRHR